MIGGLSVTVQQYVRVLRERWISVVSAVIVGLLAAVAVFFLRPPEYTAKLTMYVAAQNSDTASSAFQGAQLSQDRVKSYTELVSSTRVSREVIQRLGAPGTPEEVAKQISATSALDSVLLNVAVTGPSPKQAALMANTVGDVFTGLVAELERPTSRNGVPAVAVRVVQPATPPSAPSSTGLPVLLALGLLGGLALGVAVALVRHALDSTVQSPEQLRAATAAPHLGVVAFDSQVPKRPLIVQEDPQSPRSEAFRQLRTNLQFVDVDRPRRVIAVTSALPGEGKTTTTVNLAIAMAAAGSRVLVIEADLRHPKVADLLGVERSVGLTSVLSGRVGLEQAVQPWAGGPFGVLASGPLPPNPSELLASRQMRGLLASVRARYDAVLIDTPPLLPVTDAAAVAPGTDGVILVCRFKKTTRSQLEAAVGALQAVSAPVLGTVFSMVPNSGPRGYAPYHAYYRTETPVAPAEPVQPATAATNGARRAVPRPTPSTRGQK